ncbi:polysaccharide pyruvyl transferase family protein [Puniceicoccus vermicola]|uniref:Polysaccharide pyruvyl transferase family protein n=1 Tax=Puniceicoccus vermicola TaxID=388746 RepID=A0A7X1AWH2_9BACT|nr:polysaccharide pyruvyl transferase family protein [Puniceicoccus vermicola]MBC2601074.1 polysaccharide pyruvyl transferase family protein [Puniceicoccus vermicola]
MNIFCIRPIGFNVGNDVIYLGLKAALDEAFGCFVNLITVPATSKYESGVRSGLTSKTIHEINQYGDGVIVGGGNLYENGELDINIDALKSLEPPLMLFSLSRGRIYNRQDNLVNRTDVMSDKLLKALGERADFSLARDIATHEYLQSIGLSQTMLGGCPTIFLERITTKLPTVADRDRDCTLISVRHPSLMNISLQRQTQVHGDIANIIALLKERGHEDIRLLCHDHRDISFAASINEVPYVYISDPHAYLAMLKNCRLNITYRVHSALPCMALNTPFIKLSYDERALSLMDTVGFQDWNVDIVKSKNILSDVKDRLDRLTELPERRAAAEKSHWDRIKQTQDAAMKNFAQQAREYASIA